MPELSLPGVKPADGTAEGADRPENKPTDTTPLIETLETELDQSLKEGEEKPELEVVENEDGTVTLPKDKLEQVVKERGNYRSGMLKAKDGLKKLKPVKAEAPAKPAEPAKPADAPLTRSDFEKSNQDTILEGIEAGNLSVDGAAVESDVVKDISDNWLEVLKYFTPRRGSQTQNAVANDIMDAYTLFRKRSPKPKNDEDGETTSDLSTESGKPQGRTPEGKSEAKGGILPKSSPVKSWY